jgi:hypothetical protein
MRTDPEIRGNPAESERNAESLFDEAMQHPLATAALVLCIIAGAAIGSLFLPESIGLLRRVLGGGLMGGVSWLLVMMGRLIGG